MSNETFTHPKTDFSTPEEQHDDHNLDQPISEQPEQLLIEVDQKALKNLGRVMMTSGILPPKVSLWMHGHNLDDLSEVLPLLSEDEPIDVLEHRATFIKLGGFGLRSADRFARAADKIGVKAPKEALDRKIEEEVPVRATIAIETAREAIAKIEHDAEHIASFDNPRQQFESELNNLALQVSHAINVERDYRVRNNGRAKTEPEAPRGITGFFTKVARKVRSFFGMFKRNKTATTNEVTAYDAGAGIELVFDSLTTNPIKSLQKYPMLSKILLNHQDRLTKMNSVTKNKLAFVAPEILTFVFSLSNNEQHQRLINSVKRYPHKNNFVRHFKRYYGGHDIYGIQNAANYLLPAILNVLPTNGAQVDKIFKQIQDLLKPRQLFNIPNKTEAPVPKNKPSRLKKLFRKSR